MHVGNVNKFTGWSAPTIGGRTSDRGGKFRTKVSRVRTSDRGSAPTIGEGGGPRRVGCGLAPEKRAELLKRGRQLQDVVDVAAHPGALTPFLESQLVRDGEVRGGEVT